MSMSAFYEKNGAAFAPRDYAGQAERRRRRNDALAYRSLFLLSFALLLPVVAMRRVLPRPQTRPDMLRRSLIEETKIAASTASACAFMG